MKRVTNGHWFQVTEVYPDQYNEHPKLLKISKPIKITKYSNADIVKKCQNTLFLKICEKLS